MKYSQVSFVVFFIVGLSSGACKKQLDVYPTTSVVDGNAITDQQSAQAVLNGVYYRFADAGLDEFNTPTAFWADINELIPSGMGGSLFFFAFPSAFYSTQIDTSNQFIEDSIWNYGYALVNAANGFIKNVAPVANILAPVKQQMLAEAKFLRAFGNSELLLYYGQYNDPSSKYGIILRDTIVTSSNINLPRSGVAAAYSSILSDLDSAINGLPILNATICNANASDAKLLKARVLMNRGAMGDYAQVVSLTNDIIANGPFALEDSLKDIFLNKGFSSKEVMLGIQPYPNQTVKYLDYLSYANYLGSDALVSLLANDARNQWVYKYAYNDVLSDSVNLLTKYYSGDPTNTTQTSLSEYCYAFRLSEAYLLEAEAITLSTGDLASAKQLLTTVMSHAGAGTQEMTAVANAATPTELQFEIVKENMRNFAYENGVDWFALRRLPFASIQLLNPNITDPHKLILPIPTAELYYNNVIQNPGY
jgi:hypothetical protein